jgi:hypothetical protein
VWTFILGPILAIPAGLLVKALLVDKDLAAQWVGLFLGDNPFLHNQKRRHNR